MRVVLYFQYNYRHKTPIIIVSRNLILSKEEKWVALQYNHLVNINKCS